MSMTTGGAKALPLTGAVLVVGGTAVPAPTLAAAAAAMIVGGFLIMRLARPKKIAGVVPGRPGRSHNRLWRRGRI